MLDANELFHIAVKEMQSGATENAISHLKECITLAPNNAQAIYLLGALHAGIGMYDLATEEMQKAIDMDDTLVTARFQLGLLHTTSGRVEEGTSVWEGLDPLGENHPLVLFKNGMLSLINNEFQDCIDSLTKGISLNQENDPLNNDMANIIAEAKESLQASGLTLEKDDTPATEQAKKVSLSAYEDHK